MPGVIFAQDAHWITPAARRELFAQSRHNAPILSFA
jgi:hypothetical protein